jgi:hypothetical protein
MKRGLFFALVMLSLVLGGCSKDDDNTKTITNLSGVNWYDAQVWFRDTEGGELSGYDEVGMVTVGETCTVSTNKAMFYIYAKDARGKLIMCKDIKFVNNKATVTENDLF